MSILDFFSLYNKQDTLVVKAPECNAAPPTVSAKLATMDLRYIVDTGAVTLWTFMTIARLHTATSERKVTIPRSSFSYHAI